MWPGDVAAAIMPSSDSLKYLVQALIDGRLSPDEPTRVEQLIRDDPALAQTARFYSWLNDQLPKLFDGADAPLPQRLQALIDAFSAGDQAPDRESQDPVPALTP